MRNKRNHAAVLVLLFIILLALVGCSGQPLPEGMEEEEVLAESERIAELLGKGEVTQIYELLRDDVAQTVSEEDIKALVPDEGEWIEVVSGVAIGATDQASGENYAKAVLVCKFAKDKVTVSIALDQEMDLIGIRLES